MVPLHRVVDGLMLAAHRGYHMDAPLSREPPVYNERLVHKEVSVTI